jgi:outer membrane protein OmpA-like peptidoglycan-associated protein
LAVLALLLSVSPLPGSAQSILERARRAARNAEKDLKEAVAKKVEGATQCALDDQECAEDARRDGGRAVYVDEDGNLITDADGNPITDPEDARAAAEEPGTGVWRNYDFVPGSRVIFALDLTNEPIGRWPASQLEFIRGAGQVVELEGDTVLEFSNSSVFRVNLPEDLPDDFTVEIGYRAAAPNSMLQLVVDPEEGGSPASWERDYVSLYRRPGIYRSGNPVSSIDGLWHVNTEIIPFKLQVDGDSEQAGENTDYSILYAGTERAAMVPNAKFMRGNAIEVHMSANQRRQSYISDLVVAVHGEPLYDALTTGDRSFTTRGILFDFDSDRIRGESTPTLEDIRRTLEQHPDLTVAIEGHTDATGDADYNQELSERRAQAVVDYLTNAGIDGSRLRAQGFGESQPVADNDTEAGRAQNRRVGIRNLAEGG